MNFWRAHHLDCNKTPQVIMTKLMLIWEWKRRRLKKRCRLGKEKLVVCHHEKSLEGTFKKELTTKPHIVGEDPGLVIL